MTYPSRILTKQKRINSRLFPERNAAFFQKKRQYGPKTSANTIPACQLLDKENSKIHDNIMDNTSATQEKTKYGSIFIAPISLS